MSKFTEQEIIAHATSERNKWQTVLDLLGESPPIITEPRISIAGGKITSIKKSNDGPTTITIAPKKRGRQAAPYGTPLEVPKEWSDKLNFSQKVVFVLLKIGVPVDKETVVTSLVDRMNVHGIYDIKKLEKDVTVKLSSLFKKGLIKATRVGRKYHYSL